MPATLKTRLTDWIFQPRAPEAGTIVLVQRRVFILPTRLGVIFALVLLMMLLGAINYTLSLGFVLTFLLVALAFNAMFYTFRNLARLSVTAGRTRAVFAGEARAIRAASYQRHPPPPFRHRPVAPASRRRRR